MLNGFLVSNYCSNSRHAMSNRCKSIFTGDQVGFYKLMQTIINQLFEFIKFLLIFTLYNFVSNVFIKQTKSVTSIT